MIIRLIRLIDDKKNPVRDYMLVKMDKSPHCSTPYGVGYDAWTFVFYKHLNPNGFIPSFIDYLFLLLTTKYRLMVNG
jgi:hypothetical protein